jgi:hypothetical protein
MMLSNCKAISLLLNSPKSEQITPPEAARSWTLLSLGNELLPLLQLSRTILPNGKALARPKLVAGHHRRSSLYEANKLAIVLY